MIVKNLIGTSDSRKHGYSSWKDYYISRKSWPSFCQVYTCYGPAEVGAHVKIVGSTNKQYICPICREHNNQFGQELNVNPESLVPVNDNK